MHTHNPPILRSSAIFILKSCYYFYNQKSLTLTMGYWFLSSPPFPRSHVLLLDSLGILHFFPIACLQWATLLAMACCWFLLWKDDKAGQYPRQLTTPIRNGGPVTEKSYPLVPFYFVWWFNGICIIVTCLQATDGNQGWVGVFLRVL